MATRVTSLSKHVAVPSLHTRFLITSGCRFRCERQRALPPRWFLQRYATPFEPLPQFMLPNHAPHLSTLLIYSTTVFSGHDASRALAKTSTEAADVSPEWFDLSDKEKGVLNDWYTFFSKRYNIVGKVAGATNVDPAL